MAVCLWRTNAGKTHFKCGYISNRPHAHKSWLMFDCSSHDIMCARKSYIWHQRILFRSFSTVRPWHQTNREPHLSWSGCVIIVWNAFSTCIDFPVWQTQLMCDQWLKEQKMYDCQDASTNATHTSTSSLLYILTNTQHMFSLLQVSQPLVLFMFLSSLVWQIYNEL